jgi:hypothetical protein
MAPSRLARGRTPGRRGLRRGGATLPRVSSRQEQKEQARKERLAREAAEQKAAKRKQLLQRAGGVVIVLVVCAGALLALRGGKDAKRDTTALTAAAKAAGCVVRTFPSEGAAHVAEKRTAADYKTNPPTSGDHNINPAQDGVYQPGLEPEIENWVHTLEHGRIIFMYKPGTAAGRITQLQNLYNEPVLGSGKGYHSVLMQNNTKMPFEVAGVAWRHYVGCQKFTDKSLEALAAFREVYVDKGPEKVT